ncbi:hypothetical protein VHUM_00129 [Vanrija humicola]|uniref:Major facilitator superfamily (MFS) profile domain-containing protein n=1 Tax=Vanrija humicola TaxID=5417 RepID=A0A7D8ZAS5_VANHU|nr:hypothetical protein VHUM_00129 [Vanrija humicola]
MSAEKAALAAADASIDPPSPAPSTKAKPSDADPLDPSELVEYEIPAAETRALLRTLDWHIAPVCMVLYLIAFLDRANIGNAAVGGMVKDLHFPPNGLSVATSIFFVTYVVFEIPATMLLRTLRPSRMIPACVIIWGAVVLGNGFAKNYATVIACRLLLGICEAGLFPSLVLYMTSFYQREELALRTCYLFVASCVSGIVGGLIATGFLKMHGLRGLAGWQWLYTIEGALTILIGIGSAFVIADTHESAGYLTERQHFLMRVRAAKSAAYTRDDGFVWADFKRHARDPMIYLSGFVLLCMDVCMYGFSTFLVVIINGLGFTPIVSQALTAPVYFWGAAVYLVGAVISDRYSVRYKIIVPCGLVTAVGYAILVSYPRSVGVRLFATFLCAHLYICVGLHVTWLGQNMAGYRKRSFAIGTQLTMGNIGGIIAGQIYRTPDKPVYRLGHGASLAFWVTALIFATLEWYIWRKRNIARDNMTPEERAADENEGDHAADFRYVL